MTRKPVLGLAVAVAALALVLAATATGSPASQPVIQGCAKPNLPLVTPGRLALATDNPARRPWWNGAPTRAPWNVSNPYSTKGYESAVAYAVARRLGFSGNEVSWMPMPVDQALARGEKPFDFYLGQVTYGNVRDRAIDFSYGYYLLPMAYLARRGNPLSNARNLATVRTAFVGVVGTPAYRYVVRFLKPTVGLVAYGTYEDALVSMAYDKIGGLVVDLPTAYTLRSRVPGGGVIVGQFVRKGDSQRYALVFEQGSQLRTCVNKALAQLWSNGTIKKLQARWLTPAGGGRILR